MFVGVWATDTADPPNPSVLHCVPRAWLVPVPAVSGPERKAVGGLMSTGGLVEVWRGSGVTFCATEDGLLRIRQGLLLFVVDIVL